jgi:hypothetical protein
LHDGVLREAAVREAVAVREAAVREAAVREAAVREEDEHQDSGAAQRSTWEARPHVMVGEIFEPVSKYDCS